MKPIPKKVVSKPNHITRRRPASRTAAATEMVRLEFERDRLMRDLNVLEERMKLSNRELGAINSRLSTLQGMLEI